MTATAFWNVLPAPMMWEPADERSSSWTGHVPFAFWVIDALRPRSLVELGTWYGMSYLAFCQAIATLDHDGRAMAVDTWAGDHQTGRIAADALASLKAAHDPKYLSFSTLQRSTFDEAAKIVADGSVDLLHIDGLHTYEAVRHDFETWLPKMSDRGVVLFHDTQETHQDFGVYRFWAEVTARYPHFEFHHEHGLGVLAVGTDIPPAMAAIFDANGSPTDAAAIRALFSRLGESLRGRQTERELQQLQAKVAQFNRIPGVGLAKRLVARAVG